jgi:hypothetical protein
MAGREGRIAELKDLANRKLPVHNRLGFGMDVEQLADALEDTDVPTSMGWGILEGSHVNEVYVIATQEVLVLANAPLRKASAFVQRIPYAEIQAIDLETPGLMTRFSPLGQRQVNFALRMRGGSTKLKMMAKHRAEEIRDIVEERAMS